MRVGTVDDAEHLTITPAAARQLLVDLVAYLDGKRAHEHLRAREIAALKDFAREPLVAEDGRLTASLAAFETRDEQGGSTLDIHAQKQPLPSASDTGKRYPITVGIRFRLTKGRWRVVFVQSWTKDSVEPWTAP